MQRIRVKCIVSFVMSMVFFISSASVYAATIHQKQDLPIYIGRETQGEVLPNQAEYVTQIRAPIVQYTQETIGTLISQLEQERGTIYLTLYGTSLEEQQQVKQLYEWLRQQALFNEGPERDLHFVYTPLNTQDHLFKTMPYVETLNIEVETLADQLMLKDFYTQYQDQYALIVTEGIPDYYGEDVSTGLDVLYRVYYDLPFDYPKLKHVFRKASTHNVSPKYDAFYNTLEASLALQYETIEAQNVERRIGKEPLQLMVRIQEPIDYIEYKVNDAAAGQRFRYPYTITLDKALLHQGINQIKVVVKLKDQESYQVQDFDVYYTETKTYPERSARMAEIYPVQAKPLYKKPYIPVLMYHQIKDQVAQTRRAQSMAVSTANFEAQLKAILQAGYTPINFKQLKDYLEGQAGLPQKPFLITADDGYLCNYTKAYPILKKYQAQATFFVTSLYVGVTNEYEHFSWEQAKEMEASGLVDIQSHTHGHKLMNTLGQQEVFYEIQKSFGDIEKYLGKRDVKVLAYPQFLHTSKVKQWVKEAGVNLQVTNLVSKSQSQPTQMLDIKRIHVSNEHTPQALLKQMQQATQR